MFGISKKAPVEKFVPLDWHNKRNQAWSDFIKTCEMFESVSFKDGCATGYKKGEEPDKIFNGTRLLIPFEIITIYIEK